MAYHFNIANNIFFKKKSILILVHPFENRLKIWTKNEYFKNLITAVCIWNDPCLFIWCFLSPDASQRWKKKVYSSGFQVWPLWRSVEFLHRLSKAYLGYLVMLELWIHPHRRHRSGTSSPNVHFHGQSAAKLDTRLQQQCNW